MPRPFRLLILLLITPLPSPLKVPIARIFLGWKVGRGSTVGWSWIDSSRVEIGAGSRIGHFNIVRNCFSFFVGNNVTFLNWNKVFGSTFRSPGWGNSLMIEDKAYITSNHFFDIGGGVTIGTEAVVGGRDSQIWSHSIKLLGGKRELVPGPIEIGAKAYLGARVTLICCVLPPDCLVGAGSVVSKSMTADGKPVLIAGNPGSVRKIYSVEN